MVLVWPFISKWPWNWKYNHVPLKIQQPDCLSSSSTIESVYQNISGRSTNQRIFQDKDRLHWNEWHPPLTLIPSWYFQVLAVSENLAEDKMKAGRLKMRKYVWTCTLFSVSQWGVYMGRQVMYYLESDLPLCLIRAWLKEAVTGGFFPRVRIWMPVEEWRWTCDHTEFGRYLHTLNAKCRKCITPLLLCAWTGHVIGIPGKHYSSALHYWTAIE